MLPTHSHAAPRSIWNKGHLVGPKLALKPQQVWSVRFHLKREGRTRDLALFDLAIDSKLRGCDLSSCGLATCWRAAWCAAEH